MTAPDVDVDVGECGSTLALDDEATLPPVAAVTVVLATRDRSDMAWAAASSILGGEVLPAELLIVDQSAGADARLAALGGRSPGVVRYEWTATRGLSTANNLGVALAAHDHVLFTHDDVRVDPGWVGTLATALRADDGRVVTGRIVAGPEEIRAGFAPTLQTSLAATSYVGRVGIDVLKPLNMGMSRRVLDDVGGFDERLGPGTRFPGAEDADLGLRLLERGYHIDLVPDAVVVHRAWRAGRDYLPLRWRYGFAHGAFYAKHLSWRDPHIVGRFARDVVRRARRFVPRLAREGTRALGDPLFVLANVAGALRWTIDDRRPGHPSRRGGPR